MQISIVGGGRVGQTLGRLANEAGYEIRDVVCRSTPSAARAVRFIRAGRALAHTKPALRPTDLILVSTPDDRIKDSVDLVARNASQIGSAVVLHTSGALGSEVLSPLRKLGMKTGSCHPLQTFENPKHAVQKIASTYFCVEGESAAVRAAIRLVRKIGGTPFTIPSEMKPLYHAAAVLGSGSLIALLSISLEMLVESGLSEIQARKVLLPLVEGSVANFRALGPARALTGPVRRGDSGTVVRNIEALRTVDSKAALVYILLAERSILLAKRAGGDSQALVRVQKALKRKL